MWINCDLGLAIKPAVEATEIKIFSIRNVFLFKKDATFVSTSFALVRDMCGHARDEPDLSTISNRPGQDAFFGEAGYNGGKRPRQ